MLTIYWVSTPLLQPTAVEDPWTLIALFKQATINAKEAGFDGVESWFMSSVFLQVFINEAAFI